MSNNPNNQKDTLAELLLETGLLQFGRFEHNGEVKPFRLALEMLPSYPDVLALAAESMLPIVQNQQPVDYLVSMADSVPLGVALSQKSSIPLVYSRGRGETAVHDLVGAYDVGHPATLLLNVLEDEKEVGKFINSGKQVGLQIDTVLVVVDQFTEPLQYHYSVQIKRLLDMPHLLQFYFDVGKLPDKQAAAIHRWLNYHSKPIEGGKIFLAASWEDYT